MTHEELLKRIAKAKRDKERVLDLSELDLTSLPPEIGQLTGLQILRLDNNELTSLPTVIGEFTGLTYLGLSGNRLTSLPPEIGQLTGLERLDIDGNQLTSLQPEIWELKRLEILDLNDNQLTSLPPEIGLLKGLTYLNLYTNQLTSLPPEIGELTELKELDLHGNKLISLPPEIGELTGLQILRLYNNQLTSLPPEIGELKQLKDLFLHSNQLTSLPPEIGELKQLETLHLYNNWLTSHPPEIRELKQLKFLSLSSNHLTSLPPEIGQLKLLKELNLGLNQLTSLPPEIGELAGLHTIHLEDNRLTSLPPEIRGLKELKQLYLHENPKLGIPPEILGPTFVEIFGEKNPKIASSGAILDYYFRPKRPLNEAKLILVGFGNVGKTSLVKRLVEGTFDKDEVKTEGIKITQWPEELPGGDKVRLHTWDFGGQEIMHSTHQFFLSHRSLYLLVLNGRQGHEDSDAEYWLNLVRSFGSRSPVIVVLNKQREHPFDLNRHNLELKFPGMIKAFIKTECDDPAHGMDELKRSILYEIDRIEGLRDGFPEEWFAIKDKLAGMKDNYLTFEKYQEICEQFGEDIPTDQNRLAGYLHQLGIALNYKEDPRLRDMHVLNPRWVTEGIYTILNAKELEQQHGEMHLECLSGILDPKKYPAERHLFLMNLMRKFHLCFEFPVQEGHYLIPDLADKNQPEEAGTFDLKQCLNFQYKYSSLHEGVLPGFITRTYILSEGLPRWRTGVILAFEGCRALIKGDLTEKLVNISVSGENLEARRRLLALIRSNFEDIHRHFKFKPEEQVPVPGHPEILVSYKELLVLEQKNIKAKQQVIGDQVLNLDVQKLLNGVDLEETRRSPQKQRDLETKAAKVFYSYSHKDEALRDELEIQLTILKRYGLIDGWHDRRINPGEDLRKEIDKNLEEADIILLLISADFIASGYCYDIEMNRAMQRSDAGEATVIPIILRESNWKKCPFAKLQALPRDGTPVMIYDDRDKAWREISEKIEKIAEKIKPDRFPK